MAVLEMNSTVGVPQMMVSVDDGMRTTMQSVHVWQMEPLSVDDCNQISSLALKACKVRDVGDIDTCTIASLHTEMGLQTAECSKAEVLDTLAMFLAEHGLDGVGQSTNGADLLCSYGARFHNDTVGHWAGCLFWVLALDVVDVDLVFPSLGITHKLERGDLVLFDPAIPHGICKHHDQGRFVASSFDRAHGFGCKQVFMAGELFLSYEAWRKLGCVRDEACAEDNAMGIVDLAGQGFLIDALSGAISLK